MVQVSKLIAEKLETMANAANPDPANPDPIRSKRKAISALFPHVLRLGRSGGQGIVDMFFRTVMASNSDEFIWDRAKPFLMRLSKTESPPSLDWVIAITSPHAPWHTEKYDGNMVGGWAKAVSAVSYTEEVGQSVVDALLHIASVDSLRSHVPIDIWAWLKNQPPLPPQCLGRSRGSGGDVVRQVRALGDVEILKSYLLLVWSEWDCLDSQESGGLAEMQVSIREDFNGIEMWRHREDLIKRLDDILEQLDGRLDGLKQNKPGLKTDHISRAVAQYSELKRILVEVNAEAMNGLAGKFPRLILFCLLTPTDTHRIPFDFPVCSASPMPIVFWNTRHCFSRPLGLYTSSYPVVAFSYPRLVGSNVPNMPRRKLPKSSRWTSREARSEVVAIHR